MEHCTFGKKSHNYGIFKFKFKKKVIAKKMGSLEMLLKTKKQFKVKTLNFSKGDLLILHGNCVHGSFPNNSKISRPIFCELSANRIKIDSW